MFLEIKGYYLNNSPISESIILNLEKMSSIYVSCRSVHRSSSTAYGTIQHLHIDTLEILACPINQLKNQEMLAKQNSIIYELYHQITLMLKNNNVMIIFENTFANDTSEIKTI